MDGDINTVEELINSDIPFTVYLGGPIMAILKISLKFISFIKQAENGLQLRSFENGMTAVWHYGLILQ